MRLFRSAAGFVVGAPAFLFRSHFRVHGDSMRPVLLHGDLLHVLPGSWTPGGFERGAVVVATSPVTAGSFWVKRVVGLPGEFVAFADDGAILINDDPLQEPYCSGTPYEPETPGERQISPSWLCDDDEYFLLGDNRADSNDSRRYGPVSSRAIIGRVWFRWPRRSVPSSRGQKQ
ncbi:MAG: signal peptidase I [Chloroflexota bacterium]|nr:signal peptidase I [Chloroflexota bacterium]MDE2683740.1 signal peptidase I [Chloroflexota bacterium]